MYDSLLNKCGKNKQTFAHATLRYRKILHISYKDHVTNEEVRAKIQLAIGPHEDLLTIVKRRKLQWYGHVSRSLGLAKTILQGTVKWERRQGRQRKRWEDSIRELTGPGVRQVPESSGNHIENGENWLQNHLWCPNDPRGQGIDDDDDDNDSLRLGIVRFWLGFVRRHFSAYPGYMRNTFDEPRLLVNLVTVDVNQG